MIADTINQKIAMALKAGEKTRLSTLRMLSSALNYEKIAKQHDLSEEEELVVVRKEAKKRQDAIEAFTQAQGKSTSSSEESLREKLNQEEEELKILKEFLPAEMSDDELQKLVEEAVKETGISEIKDMGRVIGVVMGKAKGRADGKKVAEKVRQVLGTAH